MPGDREFTWSLATATMEPRPRSTSIELSESLQNWLQRLAEPQRKLIESLYWDETTEVQLADMLGLTQSGISRAVGVYSTNSAAGWRGWNKKRSIRERLKS